MRRFAREDFSYCKQNAMREHKEGEWVSYDEAASRIAELEAENTRLRALVKRAGELDRTYVGKELDAFCEECRREVSDERKEVL